MIALLVAALLTAPAPSRLPILCPAYPNDPPWRRITCFIVAHMGELPDRRAWSDSTGVHEPVQRWE